MDGHVPFFLPVICDDFNGYQNLDKNGTNCTPFEKQPMDEPISRFCIWIDQRVFYYDGFYLDHGHSAVAEMVEYYSSQFNISSKKQFDQNQYG